MGKMECVVSSVVAVLVVVHTVSMTHAADHSQVGGLRLTLCATPVGGYGETQIPRTIAVGRA
ncbi:hypothetical protein CK203_052137 [Vitis vinifera]|uniref:Uncharacterized protein n=1 Tax=Vitis vinifera TaxID=29760 RepID=A0A438GHF0_VITVI|nr:hypothetical protein CK203_052137 [Vitis vinifera]